MVNRILENHSSSSIPTFIDLTTSSTSTPITFSPKPLLSIQAPTSAHTLYYGMRWMGISIEGTWRIMVTSYGNPLFFQLGPSASTTEQIPQVSAWVVKVVTMNPLKYLMFSFFFNLYEFYGYLEVLRAFLHFTHKYNYIVGNYFHVSRVVVFGSLHSSWVRTLMSYISASSYFVNH